MYCFTFTCDISAFLYTLLLGSPNQEENKVSAFGVSGSRICHPRMRNGCNYISFARSHFHNRLVRERFIFKSILCTGDACLTWWTSRRYLRRCGYPLRDSRPRYNQGRPEPPQGERRDQPAGLLIKLRLLESEIFHYTQYHAHSLLCLPHPQFHPSSVPPILSSTHP